MAEKRAFIGQPGMLLSLDAWEFIFIPLFVIIFSIDEQSKLTVVVSYKQVYYYQDVKCRDEMYDKDILMLQVGGSQT